MKHLSVFVFALLTISVASAQKLHLTLFGGTANYQGDLQPKRFTFNQAGPAAGLGVLYELSDKLYLRGNITVGKMKASDANANQNTSRNLSFSSPVTDIHLGLEYDLLNSYQKSITPFVFAGISAFTFNPSALDTAGAKVYLQPLGTEGQGFYQGRTKYALTQMALPFGAGIKFALSENIRIRFELGLRKTFTDYLDDVSTTYADQTDLLINNGQRAVDMAFRGDELKANSRPYPNANSMRGNPESKDWYYFTGLGISFRLSPRYSGGGRNGTGCPTNIY